MLTTAASTPPARPFAPAVRRVGPNGTLQTQRSWSWRSGSESAEGSRRGEGSSRRGEGSSRRGRRSAAQAAAAPQAAPQAAELAAQQAAALASLQEEQEKLFGRPL